MGGVEKSTGGLQIPEVINTAVSSRTLGMIWLKPFCLPPEVTQGQPQKQKGLKTFLLQAETGSFS